MIMAEAIDWAAVRARLEASQGALDVALDASAERVEAILLERTRSLAATGTVAQRAAAADRVLVVRLADAPYGLWLDRLAGLAPLHACAAAPRGPASLLGLMTVRGGIWTIFDLARLLGIDSASSEGGHVVLLRHASRRIGLRVERADNIRRLARSATRPLPGDGPSPAAGLIEGLGPDGLVVIDVDALWAHPAITEAV